MLLRVWKVLCVVYLYLYLYLYMHLYLYACLTPLLQISVSDTTLLDPTPFRIFRGHSGDILDIAWSKVRSRHFDRHSYGADWLQSHFLLSASMDKTARLWRICSLLLQVSSHT